MSQKTQTNDTAKKAAANAAAKLIQDGMKIGLGTGSTAAYFIDALGERCQQGLKIECIATSQGSLMRAQKLGIPLIDPTTITRLDIDVDGADEIDSQKNMIKGGGGALLREKLVAHACNEMIVIVDETKVVTTLGRFPVPVEIASYLHQVTVHQLEHAGYRLKLRINQDKTLYQTDNGNYIADIQFERPITDPETEHKKLKLITGVVETGLFFQIASLVIVGHANGTVKVIK